MRSAIVVLCFCAATPAAGLHFHQSGFVEDVSFGWTAWN
jgi:hypothetical protein